MVGNRTRSFTTMLLVALLLGRGLARAQQAPFTLEQIMSSPFPEGLTAAPAGGAVAWVFNARGVRNIWVAQPPSYKARAITSYADDDGQDIGKLAWMPDGKVIIYTRGGDMEMGREYPNPRSFPQGVEQDVWLVALAGGQPKRLGEGHSPAVSPKSGSVAFIYKSQVWLVRSDGSEKAAQLIHSKGESDSLRWSADGSKLAFVSRRGDHSLVGVYDFTSKGLRYLDPSVDRDFAPVWSPDGKQIALIRIPASKEAFEFGPKRTGQPWSAWRTWRAALGIKCGSPRKGRAASSAVSPPTISCSGLPAISWFFPGRATAGLTFTPSRPKFQRRPRSGRRTTRRC